MFVKLLIFALQFLIRLRLRLTILPFSSQWESCVQADSSRARGHESWHMYHINTWCNENKACIYKKTFRTTRRAFSDLLSTLH